jgi:hypothetical protein
MYCDSRTICPPRRSPICPLPRNHPAGIARSIWPASSTTWALTNVLTQC